MGCAPAPPVNRKRVVTPDETELMPALEPKVDTVLINALARTRCWRRMLEDFAPDLFEKAVLKEEFFLLKHQQG